MEKNEIYCPICGHLNKGLRLEETDGWMRCCKCGNMVQLLKASNVKMRKIPVYTLDQLAKRIAAGLPLCPPREETN